MRYVAARDLGFIAVPNEPLAPLDVCEAGTELVLVPTDDLSSSEEDSLSRLTDPKKRKDNVRILAFRWKEKVRFLKVGSDVRLAPDAPIPTVQRVRR